MRRTYEDMPALTFKVELNESERRHFKRALVLLKAD